MEIWSRVNIGTGEQLWRAPAHTPHTPAPGRGINQISAGHITSSTGHYSPAASPPCAPPWQTSWAQLCRSAGYLTCAGKGIKQTNTFLNATLFRKCSLIFIFARDSLLCTDCCWNIITVKGWGLFGLLNYINCYTYVSYYFEIQSWKNILQPSNPVIQGICIARAIMRMFKLYLNLKFVLLHSTTWWTSVTIKMSHVSVFHMSSFCITFYVYMSLKSQGTLCCAFTTCI